MLIPAGGNSALVNNAGQTPHAYLTAMGSQMHDLLAFLEGYERVEARVGTQLRRNQSLVLFWVMVAAGVAMIAYNVYQSHSFFDNLLTKRWRF